MRTGRWADLSGNIQSYSDGLVRIYSVSNDAVPGDAPKEHLTYRCSLRYEERTVGVTRHYAALQANDRIDIVLRCQRVPLSALDIAVPNDGKQYRITLIQHPRDVEPPCMDLTLRRLEMDYELP